MTADSTAERTGGELVVEGLRRWGVEVVFGLPGVQLDGLFEGFALDPAIRVLHTRHEQATSYMADGYSRVTGKVGVCRGRAGPRLAERRCRPRDRVRVWSPSAVPRGASASGGPGAGAGRAA